MKTIFSILILGLFVALSVFAAPPPSPLPSIDNAGHFGNIGSIHSPVAPTHDLCNHDSACCQGLANLNFVTFGNLDWADAVYFQCMGWDAGTLLGGGRAELDQGFLLLAEVRQTLLYQYKLRE